MENSSQNGKVEESTKLTDQTQQPIKSEQPQLTPSGNGTFIRRAKGMPFSEFKKLCVKQFREAGLLKDVEPYTEEEMKQQRKMTQEMDESLMELYPNLRGSTTATDTGITSQAKHTEKD